MYILLYINPASGSLGFLDLQVNDVSSNIRSLGPLLLQMLFLSQFLPHLFLGLLIALCLDHLILVNRPQRNCLFFFSCFFPLCSSCWIISLDLILISSICPFSVFPLLVSTSSDFFFYFSYCTSGFKNFHLFLFYNFSFSRLSIGSFFMCISSFNSLNMFVVTTLKSLSVNCYIWFIWASIIAFFFS